jgi:phosphogluconate dehydratase
VHPHSELRHALTEEAARRISAMIPGSPAYRPLSAVIDERALVNGLVALLASGGAAPTTASMVALARAAGLHLTWDDLSDLSDVVPLLVRMYPNGSRPTSTPSNRRVACPA